MWVAVAAGFAFAASAWGWGALLGRVFPNAEGLRAQILYLLMGAGTLGTILTLVGLACFTTEVIASAMAVGWVACCSRVLLVGRAGSRVQVDWVSVALGFLPWSVIFVSGLAEPVGDMGNDTVSYHLAGPKMWLRCGRIVPALDHSHTAFPALVEIFYTCGTVFSDGRAAGVIGSLFFALLIAQVWELTRFLADSVAAARIAVAVAASTSSIDFTAETGFIDVTLACFAVAAARELVAPDTHWSFHGLLLGCVAASKYTGLLLVGIVLGFFTLRLLLERDHRRWVQVLSAGVMAGLIASPWYARNWLVLGCPIYPPPPVLAEIFPTAHMPPAAVQAFHEYIHERGAGQGGGILRFLALPFDLTLSPGAFHCGAGNGVALLAFGPLGVFVTGYRKRIGLTLAAFCLIFTVLWFATQKEMRFLLPVVAFACAWAGIGAAWCWPRAGLIVRILIAAVLVIHYGYGCATSVKGRAGRCESVASGPEAEQRHRQNVPYSDAFVYLNRSAGVTKLMILDSRVPPYYLNCDSLKVAGPYGERPLGQRGIETIWAFAAELQCTHVIDVLPYQIPENPQGLRLIWQGSDSRIYSAD